MFCTFGWLVGCFGLNGPLRQYFSLYRAVSQRVRKKREVIDERKNVQTTRTRTYCKHNRPLPYYNPNCRMPRHWKFTQDHRITRPPPCFVQAVCEETIDLFSLYRQCCGNPKFYQWGSTFIGENLLILEQILPFKNRATYKPSKWIIFYLTKGESWKQT